MPRGLSWRRAAATWWRFACIRRSFPRSCWCSTTRGLLRRSGSTMAAQFGYLPGTLWLIAGAAFAGCVQDFIILFCSIRRNGKSLGEMAREEISSRGGFIAQLAVLAIMIILLGVIALVIVNALKSSPWATFTLLMTIVIALLLGVYLRFLRPGRVLEASI